MNGIIGIAANTYSMPDVNDAIAHPAQYELVYCDGLEWTLRNTTDGQLSLMISEKIAKHLMIAWKRRQPYILPLP